MTPLLSVLGFLALVFLPGAWLTFLLPLPGLKPLRRLLIGAALSPLVVLLQFYALRLSGLTFERTATLLPVINIPVLYWMRRHVRVPRWPGWRKTLAVLLVLSVPAGFLWFQFRDPSVRAYTGHSWLQTDIIYSIANGDLVPEESDIAGLALGYPWAMHIFQSVVSYILDAPPVSCYHWVNFIELALITCLLIALVDCLGGGFAAKLASVPLLFFGVNFLGYILQYFLLPQKLVVSYEPAWGNYRYTPWIFYFFFFSMVPHALSIFSSLAVLCLHLLRKRLTADYGILLSVLVCCLGVLYSLIAPAAWIVFGAFALWTLWDRYRQTRQIPIGLCLFFVGVLGAAAAITLGYQALLTKDRVASGLVAVSTFRRFVAKSLATSFVFFPVWIAIPFLFRDLWRTRRAETAVLLAGGLVNCLLYVTFVVNPLTWATVEYKFILCAAVVLTPFAAVMVERLSAAGKWAPSPAILALTLLLAAPFVHKVRADWPWTATFTANGVRTGTGGPALDMHEFNLRLAAEDARSRLYDAVRRLTPVNTVLVADASPLQLPTLTRRPFYISPFQASGRPGFAGDVNTFLFEIKGYSKTLVAERRETLNTLYSTPDDQSRARALSQILQLNRPAAILVDRGRHAALHQWLASGPARSLYENDPYTLWMVDASHAVTQVRR